MTVEKLASCLVRLNAQGAEEYGLVSTAIGVLYAIAKFESLGLSVGALKDITTYRDALKAGDSLARGDMPSGGRYVSGYYSTMRSFELTSRTRTVCGG